MPANAAHHSTQPRPPAKPPASQKVFFASLRVLRGCKKVFSVPLSVLRGQKGFKKFSAPLRVLRGQKGVKVFFVALRGSKRFSSWPFVDRPNYDLTNLSSDKRQRGLAQFSASCPELDSTLAASRGYDTIICDFPAQPFSPDLPSTTFVLTCSVTNTGTPILTAFHPIYPLSIQERRRKSNHAEDKVSAAESSFP